MVNRLGALFQLPTGPHSTKVFYQPLPDSVILIRYIIIRILLLFGIVSGIGILCLKNVFRKIMIILSSIVIFDYIVSIPFILRNIPNYIDQELAKIVTQNPTVSQSVVSASLWGGILASWIIDIGFSICIIYFFSRSKVMEQFK